jgi:hypothetical protein
VKKPNDDYDNDYDTTTTNNNNNNNNNNVIGTSSRKVNYSCGKEI